MNPIEELMHLLNVLLACTALQASETRINQQDFLVQHWSCSSQEHVILVDGWRKWCTANNGYKYMGRPFFLEFDRMSAYYVNQFGEVMFRQGALMTNAYQPPCGS